MVRLLGDIMLLHTDIVLLHNDIVFILIDNMLMLSDMILTLSHIMHTDALTNWPSDVACKARATLAAESSQLTVSGIPQQIALLSINEATYYGMDEDRASVRIRATKGTQLQVHRFGQ